MYSHNTSLILFPRSDISSILVRWRLLATPTCYYLMLPDTGRPGKALRAVVLITLFVMATWGLVSVVASVRPFWVDEWRIIYNLKFLIPQEIWGKLAFMQQFPRLYLFLLKMFTSTMSYSYWSLRAIPYLAGLAAIWCIYDTAQRIYSNKEPYRYLMVMMLLSCNTFTEYFVEVKQYSMELLLAAAAVWQLHYLLRMADKAPGIVNYVLFCIAMLLCPFFSYTYPIVIAPVYIVILLHNIFAWNSGSRSANIRNMFLQWLPLFLCTFGITVFYAIDASHLATDGDMQGYWKHLMPGDPTTVNIHERIFHFLAQAGSGLVFWWLFGLSCTASVILGLLRTVKNLRQRENSIQSSLVLYGILVVLLVVALNVAGKLPLGEPRLNAFGIPALSILLIALLQAVRQKVSQKLAPNIFFYLLLAGLLGNIYTTITACFTDGKYERRIETYRATQKALSLAAKEHLPILITPGVTYPYEQTENLPSHDLMPGDWVLMTWPAYDAVEALAVYAIPDTTDLEQYLVRLPAGIDKVMVGDGLNYRVVKVSQ